MKTALAAPTKYETERIEAMKPLGCVACAVLEVPNINCLELHHILSGGIRMGHWYTIFLCRGHHQGDWQAAQLEWIEPEKRVAMPDSRRRFNAVYGSERSLWERVQARLKLPAVWPTSKVVPRRAYVESDQGLAGPPSRGVASDASEPAGAGQDHRDRL